MCVCDPADAILMIVCIFFFLMAPEYPVWSRLLTHAVGLIVLSICYCAHSILVRGVYFDAEESGSAAAVLPCFYLRYFAQVTTTTHVVLCVCNSLFPCWVV